MKFIPILRNSPTDQTSQPIFMHNGSNDVGMCNDVPSWGFVDIAAHTGSQILPKSPIFEIIRRFQAKFAKNSNFRIFETTSLIATNVC